MRSLRVPRKLTILQLGATFKDGRGSVTSIMDEGIIRRLAVVRSKKGVVRGNHYHRRRGHYVFLLVGETELVAKEGKATRRAILKPGSLVWIPPGVPHAFLSLAESMALEFGPGNYSERDAVRLGESLVEKGST